MVAVANGVSDPEVRKKLSEARWIQYRHECDKQSGPWWKKTDPSLPTAARFAGQKSERVMKYSPRELAFSVRRWFQLSYVLFPLRIELG